MRAVSDRTRAQLELAVHEACAGNGPEALDEIDQIDGADLLSVADILTTLANRTRGRVAVLRAGPVDGRVTAP